jgi:tRNA G37 N-methylase TrmD
MKIDILTIFPDFFRGPLDYGIVRRARETGLVEITFTICGRLRKTSTAPWMTARLAAARAWS